MAGEEGISGRVVAGPGHLVILDLDAGIVYPFLDVLAGCRAVQEGAALAGEVSSEFQADRWGLPALDKVHPGLVPVVQPDEVQEIGQAVVLAADDAGQKCAPFVEWVTILCRSSLALSNFQGFPAGDSA